jgi:hypothetical protein
MAVHFESLYRTFTKETEAIRTAIPSSTRYKNKWAVEVFKDGSITEQRKARQAAKLMIMFKLLTRLFKK